MASDHLTEEELRAYAQRVLLPEQLLNASDHLADCVECRERLALAVDAARNQSMAADTPNLSYDELVEYLDEDIDPLRRRTLSQKLQHSPQSRLELEDLTKFRAGINALPPNEFRKPAGQSRILMFPSALMRYALPLAAAIAVTGAALWWSMHGRETAGIVTLHDGDRAISLKANGRLRGLSGVPGELMPLIATAMREEKMKIPPTIHSLVGDREILAGAPNESSEFRVKGPVATAVRERMPRFHWNAQPNAAQYRIRIVDCERGEVIMTGESDGPRTEWTPAGALEAGKVYQWQVEALRNDEVIARTPKPPEPEARFRVLSDNERLKVESIGRSAASKSHLAMAVADAEAGLLDEATEQLRILSKENPSSQIPQKLIEQIKAVRRGKTGR